MTYIDDKPISVLKGERCIVNDILLYSWKTMKVGDEV